MNTSVRESLGEESRWFYHGMTSSDAVDTGKLLLPNETLTNYNEDAKMFELISKKTNKHKHSAERS